MTHLIHQRLLVYISDPAETDYLQRQFPPGTKIELHGGESDRTRPLVIEDLKTVIQLGMKVKDDVLKDITQFELHSRHAEPTVFIGWLESSKHDIRPGCRVSSYSITRAITHFK